MPTTIDRETIAVAIAHLMQDYHRLPNPLDREARQDHGRHRRAHRPLDTGRDGVVMGTRRVVINGRVQIDPRSTWAWRRLRDQVVREEPRCWLRLDVCTGASQTADHLVPVIQRPDLALERRNLRGACHACNMKRKAKPLDIRPNAWVI